MKNIAEQLVKKLRNRDNYFNNSLLIKNGVTSITNTNTYVMIDDDLGLKDGIYDINWDMLDKNKYSTPYFDTNVDFIKISNSDIKNMKKAYMYRNINKYELNNHLKELYIKDGYVYGSDNHRIGRFEVNNNIGNGYVLSKFVEILDWLLRKTKERDIYFGRNNECTVAKIGKYTIYGKTKDLSNYPINDCVGFFNYKNIQKADIYVSFNHKEIIKAYKEFKRYKNPQQYIELDVDNKTIQIVDIDNNTLKTFNIEVGNAITYPKIDKAFMPMYLNMHVHAISIKMLESDTIYLQENNNTMIYQ